MQVQREAGSARTWRDTVTSSGTTRPVKGLSPPKGWRRAGCSQDKAPPMVRPPPIPMRRRRSSRSAHLKTLPSSRGFSKSISSRLRFPVPITRSQSPLTFPLQPPPLKRMSSLTASRGLPPRLSPRRRHKRNHSRILRRSSGTCSTRRHRSESIMARSTRRTPVHSACGIIRRKMFP